MKKTNGSGHDPESQTIREEIAALGIDYSHFEEFYGRLNPILKDSAPKDSLIQENPTPDYISRLSEYTQLKNTFTPKEYALLVDYFSSKKILDAEGGIDSRRLKFFSARMDLEAALREAEKIQNERDSLLKKRSESDFKKERPQGDSKNHPGLEDETRGKNDENGESDLHPSPSSASPPLEDNLPDYFPPDDLWTGTENTGGIEPCRDYDLDLTGEEFPEDDGPFGCPEITEEIKTEETESAGEATEEINSSSSQSGQSKADPNKAEPKNRKQKEERDKRKRQKELDFLKRLEYDSLRLENTGGIVPCRYERSSGGIAPCRY